MKIVALLTVTMYFKLKISFFFGSYNMKFSVTQNLILNGNKCNIQCNKLIDIFSKMINTHQSI